MNLINRFFVEDEIVCAKLFALFCPARL